MILLKGKDTVQKINEEIRAKIEQDKNAVPVMCFVRIGEKPADISYERSAVKYLEGLGFTTVRKIFPAEISDAEFQTEFSRLNADPALNGIMLFLPVPKGINIKKIAAAIDPQKDMDGISPVNIAKVFEGDETGFAPCTAEAVMEILKSNDIPVSGKKVTIVGRSMVVGKPLSMLMLKENATVTICHTKTTDLPNECKRADILVAAAGRAKMLNRDFVGQNAVVIDVGINVLPDGKICGDVNPDSLSDIASAMTPVPGGVGVVTNSILAKHLMRTIHL